MSISSMTNAALARREDFGTKTAAPKGFLEIARATAPQSTLTTPAGGGQAEEPGHGQPATDAMHVIATYIPTEIITLYVAVIGVLGPPAADATSTARHAHLVSQWTAFGIFLAVTPLVVWIVFATKVTNAGKALPIAWAQWPKWEMTAATIAFAAWAFGLPQSPFAQSGDWYSPGLAGLAVLLTSSVLGLISPLFQQKLNS